LDNLKLSNKVYIVVSCEDVVDPFVENISEPLVGDQPGGVERQAEGSLVSLVVTQEVVVKKLFKLILVIDIGARGYKMTTGQILIKVGIITPVELVDGHLPDWMRPTGAVVVVTVALVRHSEVECVWPEWNPAERSGDGRIVSKELIGHHVELLVASNTEIRCSHANHCAVSNVRKPLNDKPVPGHLRQPVVIATVSPVLGILIIGDGKNTNLVTLSMKLLHSRVVGILMGYEESAFSGATIRVETFAVEQFVENTNVLIVNSTVKGECDHHRKVGDLQLAPLDTRSCGSISRTEAVGQQALGRVTNIGFVWILGHTAGILVTAIVAVRLLVTEERLRDTLPISTLELAIGTHGLLGVQIWLYQAGLGQTVAVVNLGFPVTSLPLKIECKTRWTFNRGQPDGPCDARPVTPHHIPAVALGGQAKVLVSRSSFAQIFYIVLESSISVNTINLSTCRGLEVIRGIIPGGISSKLSLNRNH